LSVFLLGISATLLACRGAVAQDADRDPASTAIEESADDSADVMRAMQKRAEEEKRASWGHWGKDVSKYSTWTSHSNRLIPIYTFGIDLSAYRGANSPYRDAQAIKKLYGYTPSGTLNSRANYFDQTNVYDLQQEAVKAGKKYVILVVFDGMDWETTRAAAIYKSGKLYETGRGSGLTFQDYQGAPSDYGFFVTSPHNSGTNADLDAQTVLNEEGTLRGG
jgi:alkaline phosphatase